MLLQRQSIIVFGWVVVYFQKNIIGFLHASLYMLHFFIACGSMCGNWRIPQRVSDKDTFKKEKEKENH